MEFLEAPVFENDIIRHRKYTNRRACNRKHRHISSSDNK